MENSEPYYLDKGGNGTFSPDGKKVAIFSCESETASNKKVALVYIKDLATGQKNIIYKNAIDCLRSGYITWSPSAGLIAFSYFYGTIQNYSSDLYLLNMNSLQIDHLATNSWSPSWAPEGEILVYVKGDAANNNSLIFEDIQNKCSISENIQVGEVSWSLSGKQLAIAANGDITILRTDKFYKNGILNSDLCK